MREKTDASVRANADDLHDYRPGTQAASEQRVRSPLAECGFTKDEVRELAQGGKKWIAGYQAEVSRSTGIANLKVGFMEEAESTLKNAEMFVNKVKKVLSKEI